MLWHRRQNPSVRRGQPRHSTASAPFRTKPIGTDNVRAPRGPRSAKLRSALGGHRRVLVGGVCALVVAASAIGTAAVRTSASRRVTRPLSYVFTPASYPDGLVVTRSWTVPRGGRELTASIVATNDASGVVDHDLRVVVPKELARSVDAVRFAPPYDSLITPDPVVMYHLAALQPRQQRAFAYHVALHEALDQRGLAKLARDATREEDADERASGQTPTPLRLTLRVEPPILRLDTQSEPFGKLTVITTLPGGSPAPLGSTSAVVWSSDHPDVAAVGLDGSVTALGAGTATVTAEIGNDSAQAMVAATSGGLRAEPPPHFASPSPTLPPATTPTTTSVVPLRTIVTTPPPIGTQPTIVTPPSKPKYNADINGDGVVNCADEHILASEWNQTGSGLPADLNHDGVVNVTDLAIMSKYWTPGQPNQC